VAPLPVPPSEGSAAAAAPDLPGRPAHGVRVSVVVPVYNSQRYLAECLDSILGQDLPAGRLEVVAVDDGSTDGSGALLDDYAARHACVRVVHQENSGWPGRPRNVGLAAARGRYVFFADSDDRLGPEALRRMADFADAYSSDVVVAKLVQFDGTPFGGGIWQTERQVDADLRQAIVTLGPWKLFRREFVDRQGLRFPEGKVRLEDGIFVTEAYVTARRVSVLADYDYYFKRDQDDRGNISSSRVDAAGYTGSVATMMRTVRQHCADRALADALVIALYRRKGLKWFAPDRFPGYSASRRAAWVEAVADLAEQHVPPALDAKLPLVHRVRSTLVRARETEALRRFGAMQQAGRPLESVVAPDGLELRVPGLRSRSSLQVSGGLRLVPVPAPPPAASSRGLQRVRRGTRRRLGAVARRTTPGRWALARYRRWAGRGS
jgi:poly(ribitol-phosphate) beta-N-acetylglucosaminyltransferase